MAFSDTSHPYRNGYDQIPAGSRLSHWFDLILACHLDTNQRSSNLHGAVLGHHRAIQPTDKVLHVGTGSGYFTALLAHQAEHVYSLEIDSELNATASYKLAENDIHNVTMELADGVNGFPAKQPYDVIVFTGSSPVEPPNVREQLKVGGVMFIVLGKAPVMEATLI